jgi:pseudaminic acid synthase
MASEDKWMKSIKIGAHHIGNKHSPFIIAEMSGNHNQSLTRALKIIEAAAKAGVDAVKLQTYTADTMTIDLAEREFFIDDPKSLWYGKSLYELYKEAHTPWEWHKPIFDLCKKLGLICFSTPFDETAVELLESLDVPAYKVASFENNHLPFLESIARTGKPIIISTGMATIAELDEAVSTAREAGCTELILLKCTSTYPASPQDTNLATIPHMRDLFKCQVGLSDHTLGVGAALASIALGATVIEKHFTLRKADGGVDSAFSMEPNEMYTLVKESKRAWQALGIIHYGPLQEEEESLVFRRSIYATKDIRKGEFLTEDNISIIRPGYGIQPKFYKTILGFKAPKNIHRGTPLHWDLIK